MPLISYQTLINFFIAKPGTVYLNVSNLLDDTKVRINWVLPSESTIVTITSYQVVYSMYEAVSDINNIRLSGNVTNYVIQNLSKLPFNHVKLVADLVNKCRTWCSLSSESNSIFI